MARHTGLEQLRNDRDTAWEARQWAQSVASSARTEVRRLRRAYTRERKALLTSVSSVLHELIVSLQHAEESHRVAYRACVEKKRAFDRAHRRLAQREAVIRTVQEYPQLLAAIPEEYGYDVKIRPARGDTMSIYVGGLGEPDGYNHGHYVVECLSGKVIYRRDPGQPHGTHNYR